MATGTMSVPIGTYTGVFDVSLLLAMKKARNIDFTVEKVMRQERDFKTLAKFTNELVIGQNGPGYSFTLVLDRQPYFRSPAVWGSEDQVKAAVPAFIEYVRQMPLQDQQKSAEIRSMIER